MNKTLEQVIREEAASGELVGTEFTVRVLADTGNDLEMSIRLKDGEKQTDFNLMGDESEVYEEV